MKKNLLFTILSCLLLTTTNCVKALDGSVKFHGSKNALVSLEVAVTDEEKNKGLMNRPSLDKNHGMVFIFRPARKVTFWMKDTLIPLDMIFIRNGKIVKIVKNAIPNQTEVLYPSDFETTEVVEVNGGYADSHMISVGNKVTFKNIPEINNSKKSKT